MEKQSALDILKQPGKTQNCMDASWHFNENCLLKQTAINCSQHYRDEWQFVAIEGSPSVQNVSITMKSCPCYKANKAAS